MATLQQIEDGIRKLAAKNPKDPRIKVLGAERARLMEQGGAPEAAAVGPTALHPSADRAMPQDAQTQSAQNQAVDKAAYNDMPGWQKPLQAGVDLMEIYGKAPFLGGAEHAIAGIKAPFSDKDYRQLLAEEQRSTEAARNRSGTAGLAAEFGGLSRLPSAAGKVAKEGAGWVKKGLTSLAEGAGYGGASRVLSAPADDPASAGDVLTAMGVGGAISGGGSAALSGGGALVKSMRDAVATFQANPSERARQAIYDIGAKMGITGETINTALKTHGGETMAADLLGKKGARLGREAGRMNTEAKDIMEDRLAQRQSGQNERITNKLDQISGAKPEPTTAVDMKNKVRDIHKDDVTAAYRAAEEAGFDLPLTPYREILSTPMGREAWKAAGGSLRNLSVGKGKTEAGMLERLDLAKKHLDAIAASSRPTTFNAGNQRRYAEASLLSKQLREKMDESIAGDEYVNARAVGQKSAKTQAVVDTGFEAAKTAPRVGTAAKARAAETAEDKLVQRQAFAHSMRNRLSGKQSVPADIANMHTPAGQDEIAAVFGNRAPVVKQAAATEKMFSKTGKDLTGGVGKDAAAESLRLLGSTGVGMSLAALTGIVDPTTGGAIGAGVRGGRIAAPFAQRMAASKGYEAAPEIARLLSSGPEAIPLQSPLQRTPDMSPQFRELFARLLTAGAARSQQQ